MKRQQELTVISKCYDLVLWTVNHTSRFPRQHRHVLGDRIEQHLYDVLETLVDAKYTSNRRDTVVGRSPDRPTVPTVGLKFAGLK